ncbi:MAG: hypothetical protein JSV19_09535 [Phycisphaerales bacterium]|nr:MAG: hypothetical protein JSV19_09535 [Phycisphaerales bacterium]
MAHAMQTLRLTGVLCALCSAAVVLATPPPDEKADKAPKRIPLVPENLPDDLTVWPNKVCYRMSEPWIMENHDKIRKIKPRVMILNFANDASMEHIKDHTERLIRAFSESTRYHGFKDPDAPSFLDYEVVKYVDMRDRPVPPERKNRNSAFFPALPDGPKDFAFDYAQLYTDQYARFYGFADANYKYQRRYLNLHELIEAGIVHELWFHAVHDHSEGWPANEVIEYKQYYDEKCRPIPGKHGPAGNGHSKTMPWSGRTFRMAFFNPHRDIGCALENFAHGLEGIANHNAIAYYTKYFNEYAGLDLDERHDVPFKKLYDVPYGAKNTVTYPTKTSIKVTLNGNEHLIDPYEPFGGNVHWMPGARFHYDLDSPHTVSTTMENYRLRNGPGGKDKVTDFNKQKFAQFTDIAPDCMGRWTVFWRQCMPGLGNKCVDDDGKPMKNWWVFLIY